MGKTTLRSLLSIASIAGARGIVATVLQSQSAPPGGPHGHGGGGDGADEAQGSVLGRAASKSRPNYERRRSPHDSLRFNFNLVFNSVVLGSNALFMLACSWRRWQVSPCRCLVGLVVTNMLCPGLVVVFDSLPAELGNYFLMVALESLFWVTCVPPLTCPVAAAAGHARCTTSALLDVLPRSAGCYSGSRPGADGGWTPTQQVCPLASGRRLRPGERADPRAHALLPVLELPGLVCLHAPAPSLHLHSSLLQRSTPRADTSSSAGSYRDA